MLIVCGICLRQLVKFFFIILIFFWYFVLGVDIKTVYIHLLSITIVSNFLYNNSFIFETISENKCSLVKKYVNKIEIVKTSFVHSDLSKPMQKTKLSKY